MSCLLYFIDIQECRDGLHNCGHICVELDGDFECACHNGFTLEDDNATCSGMYVRKKCVIMLFVHFLSIVESLHNI